MTARPSRFLPLLAAFLAGSIALPAQAASSFTKPDSYKNPAIKAGGSLSLTNMLGQVSVQPASDGVLTVDSKVVAAAGSDADAQALAGKIRIEVSASGNNVSLTAHYPLDDYTEYYYRQENSLNIGFSTTTTSYEGTRVRISDGTFGTGANLHVDFVVHVPQGVKVTVDNKVGRIDASGVSAPLVLKSGSGDISGEHNNGALAADTGSGDIVLSGHSGALDLSSGSGDITLSDQKSGEVKADTGSGDLKLDRLDGALTARTGSGDVSISDYNGPGADLETGSGDIVIRGATGSLKLRTGSGEINATGYKAGQVVECHAGSGDINLSGDLSAVLHLTAESGSGDIVLHTSAVPSLHITATSDSGDVDVDLPGLQNVSARSHSIRGDVNGAKGTAEIEAGSGDVTFTKN
jgi:DUF4097 and DUF4098 domain-containing protein YvlB